MSISCAFASEYNSAVSADGSDVNLDVNVDGSVDNFDSDGIAVDEGAVDEVDSDVVTVDNGTSDNLVSGDGISDNRGTFDDLDREIRDLYPGDVYNIDRDYYYDAGGLVPAKYGIIINVDNVVINGNGHTLDGMNKSVIFSVYGKNVKIFNLTFINSYFENPQIWDYDTYSVRSGRSPINWEADNGVLSDCVFVGNAALIMGGAITWLGNNGLINNSIFINNTAGVIGGAIYIGGTDNVITNCLFINSTSLIGREVVFVDRIHKNCNLSAIYNGKRLVLDGSITNIDVSYLNYIYETVFAGEKINLIPLIYSAIMSPDDCVFLSRDLTYYAQYIGNDFIFTLVKDFGGGFVYEWDYHITGVENLSDVYAVLLQENYKVDVTVYENVSVNSAADYEKARRTEVIPAVTENLDTIADDLNSFALAGGIVGELFKVLNVNFERALTIDSKGTWDPSWNGFDKISIDGHGSTINGNSGDRDEYKWATITEGYIFDVNFLTVRGFNTAIENLGGSCFLKDVHLDNNRMKYWIDRDWGAAILNAGVCVCIRCLFTNNYCSNGGAIFNQGNLTLEYCDFQGNEAYRNGDNILNVDEGVVTIDDVEIKGSQGWVKYIESTDDISSFILHFTSYLVSFFVGFVVGVVTVNPTAAVIAGVATGAVLGSLLSVYLIKTTYDVNYNRFKACLLAIGGSMVAGAFGGCFGTYLSVIAADEVVEEAIVVDNYMNGLIDVSSSSSISDTISELSMDVIEELSEGVASM